MSLRAAARLALGLSLLGVGCRGESELATGHLALRNSSGALVKELRATSYGYLERPGGLRIQVGPGRVDAGRARIEGNTLHGESGSALKIERSQDRVALFQANRAPAGQLLLKEGRVWAYDAGGTPLGSAHRDKDRMLLLTRDGASAGYTEALSLWGAAALLLGPPLSDLEKWVLSIYLSRS